MKALELVEYGKLEYKEVGKPVYGENEVLIRVKACAICGSDVHGFDGSSGRRIPPVIMGHEAAGVLEEVGSSVKGFSPGDRVTFDSTLYCGTCSYCRSGRINLCDNRKVFGVSCTDYKNNGAMAEYISVPAYLLYRLPENISYEEAAVIEPLTVALHAINRTKIHVGDNVVVVGTGTIGQLIIKVLAIMGCGEIIAIDIDESKLEMAKANGAQIVIKSDEVDVIAGVRKLTNGKGMDVAFEAVGITKTVATALRCLKKGGELTLVGNISNSVDFLLQDAVTREVQINCSCASAGEYDTCLQLLEQKKITVKDIINVKASLQDGAKWFEQLHKGAKGIIKVVLMP